MLQAFHDGRGWRAAATGPPARAVPVRPETLAVVRRGLWSAVNRAGTGGRGRIEGRDVLGKTGTAQVISRAGRAAAGEDARALRDHGWFIFAAPADDPQVAGVVFAEHAEHGYLAAPIARHALETFFAKREGRSLPDLPALAEPPPAPLTRPAAPPIDESLVVGGD